MSPVQTMGRYNCLISIFLKSLGKSPDSLKIKIHISSMRGSHKKEEST